MLLGNMAKRRPCQFLTDHGAYLLITARVFILPSAGFLFTRELLQERSHSLSLRTRLLMHNVQLEDLDLIFHGLLS